jgi:hypothetical protein
MTKLINMKLIQKNEIPDLLRPRFICQRNSSSFQNIFCDGLVKIANYLKCNQSTVQLNSNGITKVVIYAFESQLVGFEQQGDGADDTSDLSSSILKFSRCIEKLCEIYHLKVHLICAKILSPGGSSFEENKLFHTIRLLLNPFKDHIIVETMENRFLHYEYNFKDHIRENISPQVGEIELPSIDDTRATLFMELLGTTLSANDTLRTISLQQNRIKFTLLCTLPRSGLYPVCTIGNPTILTPARGSLNTLRYCNAASLDSPIL